MALRLNKCEHEKWDSRADRVSERHEDDCETHPVGSDDRRDRPEDRSGARQEHESAAGAEKHATRAASRVPHTKSGERALEPPPDHRKYEPDAEKHEKRPGRRR